MNLSITVTVQRENLYFDHSLQSSGFHPVISHKTSHHYNRKKQKKLTLSCQKGGLSRGLVLQKEKVQQVFRNGSGKVK